jgi:hypothetical protein
VDARGMRKVKGICKKEIFLQPSSVIVKRELVKDF